jgi:hypothetical protein
MKKNASEKAQIDFQRLTDALDHAYQNLQPFREKRMEALRQFVGEHYEYAGEAYDSRYIANMMELAVNVWARLLVPREPQCEITANVASLTPMADNLSLAINHVLNEIDFEDAAKRFVVSGLFGIAALRVGYEPSGKVSLHGQDFDLGQPYIENIDLDWLVYDTRAPRWGALQFMGSGALVPLEIVRGCGLYPKEITDNLAPITQTLTNDGGDDRANSLSNQNYVGQGFLDEIEIWQIYLPLHRQILTLAKNQTGFQGAIELSRVPWTGPEEGPYTILSFSDVPGNLYPNPPVNTLITINEAINRLLRKVVNQGEARKILAAVVNGDDELIDTLRMAQEGDFVSMSAQTVINPLAVGQVDPQAHGLAVKLQSDANYLAGNLDALGGLSAQSGTASQDQMLFQNASVRIAEMGSRASKAMKKAFRKVGWYLFHDPLIQIPISKRIVVEGLDPITIETVFQSPRFERLLNGDFGWEAQEADFYQFNFTISVYSQMEDTPMAKLSRLKAFIADFLIPLQPFAQQQGINVNAGALLKTAAKFMGIPQLEESILDSTELPAEPIMPGPGQGEPKTLDQGSGMPAQTKRTYERVSRTAGTRRGQDHVYAMTAMGSKTQNKQSESLGKGTG